jgi:hypothetical protein
VRDRNAPWPRARARISSAATNAGGLGGKNNPVDRQAKNLNVKLLGQQDEMARLRVPGDARFYFSGRLSADAETAAPQARPVRTVTVVKRAVGETVSYTGRIEAEDEARMARFGSRGEREPGFHSNR